MKPPAYKPSYKADFSGEAVITPRLAYEIPDSANFSDTRKHAPFAALLTGSDDRGVTIKLRYDTNRFAEQDIGRTVFVAGAQLRSFAVTERFVDTDSGGRAIQASFEFSEHWTAVFAVVESTSTALVPSHPEEFWEGGRALRNLPVTEVALILRMWEELPALWAWKPIISPKRTQ